MWTVGWDEAGEVGRVSGCSIFQGMGGSLDGKPEGFLTRLGTEFGDHLEYTLKAFRKECNYF